MYLQRTVSDIYSHERKPKPLLMLMTIFGYALLGCAGLVLATPPGYASPVFPAAGFAIAITLCFGRSILPAIWLGSLILNIGVAFVHGVSSTTSLWVAVGIATGSTLQTFCAYTLVQYRLSDKWRYLENERDILSFLLISGPVACIIAATIGLGCLLVAGIIPPYEWAFGWWNWYIGDTLGVLLFSPLMIGWIYREEKSWSDRLKTVTIPIIVMLGIASITFLSVTHWEQNELDRKLRTHGERLSHLLHIHLVALQEVLTSLTSFIEVTPNMTVDQFNQFTKVTLNEHPDIAALSFNQILPDNRRKEFESNLAHRYSNKTSQIMEQNAQGILTPAPHRTSYVVVSLIAPFQGNVQAIGFNIDSEEIRHAAIIRSRMTGLPAVTAKIHLVQGKNDSPGILVLSPVWLHTSTGIKNNLQSDQQLNGFAVAVIKVNELVEIAAKKMSGHGFEFEITDSDSKNQLLYSSLKPGNLRSPQDNWQTSVVVADRKWNLKVSPDASYIQRNRPILAWLTGIIGLLLTSMMQIILLGITGRNNLISRKVNDQTIQLSEKNTLLTRSEARYASVVNNVKEIIFQRDAQGHWIFLNRTWKEITGFPVETSLGTYFLDYVHPEDRQLNHKHLELLIQEKKDHYRYETRYLHKDGGFRWIIAFARIAFDDQGSFIGTSGTLTDITEQKITEQNLKLAAAAFTHTREGVLITAKDTTILDVNGTFTAITGYSREEVIGKTPQLLKSGLHDKNFYQSLWLELEQNGEWYGELWNRRKNGEIYVQMLSISKVTDNNGQVQNYIGLFSDITSLKNQQEQLKYNANYDPLTNLPNRILLADRLHQAMTQSQRRQIGFIVVYIDLDGFKPINDNFGHASGDVVLKCAANNMKHVLREGDTLARIGGDEFVAIILDIKEIESSKLSLDRLLIAANKQIQVGDRNLHVTASIGVTFYTESNAVNAEVLLDQADNAMYQAKLAGKNRYVFYQNLITTNSQPENYS